MLCYLNTIYNGLYSPKGDISNFQEIYKFSDIFNESDETSSELGPIKHNVLVNFNDDDDGWS
jgi:hypothetical protein